MVATAFIPDGSLQAGAAKTMESGWTKAVPQEKDLFVNQVRFPEKNIEYRILNV